LQENYKRCWDMPAGKNFLMEINRTIELRKTQSVNLMIIFVRSRK
jgi:hypothetical protein